MRLSTSTNIFSERIGFPRADQRECIRLCSEAGYRVMDFCFQDLMYSGSPFLEEGWEAYIDSVMETAADCQIEFSQGHAIIHDFCRPKENHEFLQNIMERCIDAAARLGIKWLTVHPSTDEGALQVRNSRTGNIAYFSRLLEKAVPLRVGLAFENMWDLHLAPRRLYAVTAEELVDLVDALGDGTGICWDVEHGSIMKQDQKAALGLIGRRLKAVHISDQTGMDNIHILPYLGCSDWNEIIEALAIAGYQGDLTYELQWFLRRMPLELVPVSLRYSINIGNHLLELFKKALQQI